MEIIQFLAIEIFIPLGIVALMHFKLAKNPEPLPLEENKRRGIWEALGFWLLTVIVLTVIGFAFVEKMADPEPVTLVQIILLAAIPYVLIPVLYLRLVRKWTLRDFGFRKPVPGSWGIIIFTVILFAFAGVLPLLLNPEFTPMPVIMIIFALVWPAFFEEFLFRGVIQGRLERVIGQNKAWIFSGILFGLAHVTTNYFIQGMDLVSGIFQLLGQIIAGWIYGILYMKTRSLYPGMLAHFLTDARLASIIAWMFLS